MRSGITDSTKSLVSVIRNKIVITKFAMSFNSSNKSVIKALLEQQFQLVENADKKHFLIAFHRYVDLILNSPEAIDLVKFSISPAEKQYLDEVDKLRRQAAIELPLAEKMIINQVKKRNPDLTKEVDIAILSGKHIKLAEKGERYRIFYALNKLWTFHQNGYISSQLKEIQYLNILCELIVALNIVKSLGKGIKGIVEYDKYKFELIFIFSPAATSLDHLVATHKRHNDHSVWDSWLSMVTAYFAYLGDKTAFDAAWRQHVEKTDINYFAYTELIGGLKALSASSSETLYREIDNLRFNLQDVHNYLMMKLSLVPSTPSVHEWEDLVIEVLDNETLSIGLPNSPKRKVKCQELGMDDKRTGKPNSQWDLLLRYAEGNGSIVWSNASEKKRHEKTKERMGKALQEYFNMQASPFWDKQRLTSKANRSSESLVSIMRFKTSHHDKQSQREKVKLDHELIGDYGDQITRLISVPDRKRSD